MRCDNLTKNFRSKGLRDEVVDPIRREQSIQVVEITLSKTFLLPTCIVELKERTTTAL